MFLDEQVLVVVRFDPTAKNTLQYSHLWLFQAVDTIFYEYDESRISDEIAIYNLSPCETPGDIGLES